MAIDFPNSPSVNDSFTVGNRTWIWDGTTWELLTTASDPIQKTIVDAKGDLIGGTGSDTVARLAVGTNEHRLVADSGETTGLKYVADTTNYAVGAKGDLLVGTAANTLAALSVGTNGYILTADSGETIGLKWTANASGMNLITTGSISAGTSLNFDGCFTSTYRNYQIRCNFVTSVGNSLRIRFRASGVNNTTSNYQLQYFALNNTTITSGRLTGQPNLQISTNDANFQTGAVIDIFSPQEATETILNCHFAWDDGSSTTPALANYSGNFSLTDQFDGINLFILGGGTFTGDFAIYGMSN